MGTRLLSEQLIKQYYPQLRYVRAHTSGRNAATLYVWNEDLELPERDADELKRFVDGYLPSYVCFQIKAYSMVQADRVPQVSELPDTVIQTALRRDLDRAGIEKAMNAMLANGGIAFSRYDYNTGILHFNVHTTDALTDIEQELIRKYLSEMIPLGSRCEISYS
ncbi:hypothetical protein D7Z26_18045 [Cohnella endophytica]|uniref:Uncharacterized protein n=1 Tax=Cohnella endophytica TaxID=2419778 RepID=A0A494XLV0_9BACL|nr:hypothetical protein [Cohnella endophytica]RKP51670.1 hypothetical protein D7Z26_18045 [Cohnella endophytica]